MSNGLILLYHRITSLRNDPHRIAVQPDRFAAHLEHLRKNFTILTLREMVERIRTSHSVQNCVAITFDDGYADNLHEALPILENFQVPATIFVTAGMVGSPREFWWDELDQILRTGRKTGTRLDLNIGGRPYSLEIGPGESFLKFYPEVHRLLKYLPSKEREQALDELSTWRQIKRDAPGETHRILDETGLRALARSSMVEIGSHTLSHPVLSTEPDNRQWTEIRESRTILEQITGGEVLSFSYPFGQRSDFGVNTVRMVQEAGYACGITNIQGQVDDKTNLYQVPRRIIRNWEPDEFRKQLAGFLAISAKPVETSLPSPGTGETTEKIERFLRRLKPCHRNLQSPERPEKIQNILFINHFDCQGGAGKLSFRLFERLLLRNLEANLLVRKKYSGHFRVNEINAAVPAAGPDQEFLSRYQEQKGWVDFFYESSFSLIQSSFFQQADLVHLHNLQKFYFSLLALPEITCRKPVIWTLHDMYSFTGHCCNSYGCSRWSTGCGDCPHLDMEVPLPEDTSALLWQMKKIIYRYSDLTIAVPSRWLQRQLQRSILKDKPVALIYNGVDETVFYNHNKQEARRQLELPLDRPVLLFTAPGGTAIKTKGGHLIPAIAERLGGRNVLLTCIGGSAVKLEGIKTISHIDDENLLALYYAAADLFIYPSLADNCPLVVLEALSCGTPVIAFDTGGIPELVTHKKTGYIAPYQDLAGLTAGIEFFLDHPALMAKAGHRARRSVLKHFTLDIMVNKYQELYKKRCRRFWQTPYSVDGNYSAQIRQLLISSIPR